MTLTGIVDNTSDSNITKTNTFVNNALNFYDLNDTHGITFNEALLAALLNTAEGQSAILPTIQLNSEVRVYFILSVDVPNAQQTANLGNVHTYYVSTVYSTIDEYLATVPSFDGSNPITGDIILSTTGQEIDILSQLQTLNSSALNFRNVDYTRAVVQDWQSSWMNVQGYNNLQITISGSGTGVYSLKWAATYEEPSTDVSVFTGGSFDYSNNPQTQNLQVLAKWVYLDFSGTLAGGDINPNIYYKKAPTEVDIFDASQGGKLKLSPTGTAYRSLTDTQGTIFGATDTGNTSSLYVHLTDASGDSLDIKRSNGLSVLGTGLYDSSNVALGTTINGGTNNSLFAYAENAYSICGNLFYALSDSSSNIITTTKSQSVNNALYVNVNNQQGTSIAETTPLNVIYIGGKALISKSFDLTFSGQISTHADIDDISLNIRSLNVINQTPLPVWVKVYDASVGSTVNDLSMKVVMNLPVKPFDFRDVTFDAGTRINAGLRFAATQGYEYTALAISAGYVQILGTYDRPF